MQLTFLGAAGEVTGSCYLIETGAVRFLVDCGMFHGGREADKKIAPHSDSTPKRSILYESSKVIQFPTR